MEKKRRKSGYTMKKFLVTYKPDKIEKEYYAETKPLALMQAMEEFNDSNALIFKVVQDKNYKP
jgi:tagatose-1,6-bisphosphate aldolase